MSLEFPLRPDPKFIPPINQQHVFPPTWRAKFEAIAVVFALVLSALVASFMDETPRRVVGALLATAIVIAWVAWLAADARKLSEAIRTYGPFDPDHRPNLRLPIWRCVEAPVFAAGVLLFTYGEQLVPVAAVLIFLSYVVAGVSGALAQYAMLPADSVEAAMQRNAAALSFLITLAVFSGITGIGLVVANGILKHGMQTLQATCIAISPMVLSIATYGIVLFVLKRRMA